MWEHTHFFLEKLGIPKETIDALLIDVQTAPIDESTKLILEFAVQITKEPLAISDDYF